MKKAFSWVLIPVFLALILLGIVVGKNWDEILKIVSQKTEVNVLQNLTPSPTISSAPTITLAPIVEVTPTTAPAWKTYTGETIYTTDGSSKFSIEYPPDWVLSGNKLNPSGSFEGKTPPILILGAGGHGLDFDSVSEEKTYPAGKFTIITGSTGSIIASMPKNNISYIFEFQNVPAGAVAQYKETLDKMLGTLKLL